MSRLRVAVVGAGNVAQSHLQVLTDHPDCEVVALVDPAANTLAATADRFRISERLDSADALLGRDDIDAVFVLVSVVAVANVAARYIDAGLPTFLEKPPGLYSSETEHLAELQQKRGTIATVGLNKRYYSNLQEMKSRLAAVGPVVTVALDAHEDLSTVSRKQFSLEVLRRWPYANGIHGLDLLRFFGGDVAEVESHAHTVENAFPDSFSAMIRFESGAAGRAAIDLFGPGEYRCEVHVVGATAILEKPDWFGTSTLFQRGRPDESIIQDEDDHRYKQGFWKQDSAFLKGVRAGTQPPWPAPDLADAHQTMVLIDQICQLPATPD
jgi:phthalate 4,5-cis-dihydrodiol dehydrogenase